MEELPGKDLDGQDIHVAKGISLDVKKGKTVDETLIANVRYQLKIKFFLYKRKKARWMEIYHYLYHNV